MTLLYWVVGTATLWAVAFAVYIFAVRARWLSRFEKGFLFEIGIALVGVALMAASVVGVWGYLAAGHVLDQELLVEMQDIGALVESEVGSEIDDIQHQLNQLGTALAGRTRSRRLGGRTQGSPGGGAEFRYAIPATAAGRSGWH
jgi:hypothetical protein